MTQRGAYSAFRGGNARGPRVDGDSLLLWSRCVEFTAGRIQPPPYRQLPQRELVPGGLCQSFQNPLNRSGASLVYRTVEAIERWPR